MKTCFAILFLGLWISQAGAQTLHKVWETDTLLSKPESVIYDPLAQVIYVSNINGKYCTKDGNGYISKIDVKDGIIDLK